MIGTGPMKPVAQLALRTVEPYAERHGYDLVLGSGVSGGRGPSWGKVCLLRRLLEGYDEILWLDSDILILDDSVDIANAVPAGCFQGLVEQQVSPNERAVNAGVWFLRADPRAVAFLDAVWRNSAEGEPGMWENLQMLDLLGYSTVRPYRPLRVTEWHAGTALLDQAWNAMGSDTAGRFRHYSALPNESRLVAMKWDLAELQSHGRIRGPAARFLRRCRRSIYFRTRHRSNGATYMARRIAGDREP